MRDRIDRSHAEPLDVPGLAAEVGLSAGHLSREFKRAYGESPYSYLMTRRIERAMTLLRRGDLGVTEVCFAVGYGSLGTFSTRFSELVGCSPSEYRARAAVDGLTGHLPGAPPCLIRQATRPVRTPRSEPVRNGEAPGTSAH
ncbi:helix-turn-helix transcriptional regulator [Nocardioides nanhaiensis]|uniref:Helix-turn-helix transcriptional regulator n=1 Tax=Nocardioides nanhaiensis TaxID=1476871 RepID=A0ABP8WCD3_9ACTN